MSHEKAIESGCIWEESKTEYQFVSCKLVEGGIQPMPPKKEVINNISTSRVVINKSIF